MVGGSTPLGDRRRLIPYQPALDGLRGLAVVGVLLYHGGVWRAPGGFLGVSTFFTLSGFLITSLLILERERDGSVRFRRFWARRFRRLMPAAWLGLVLAAAYGAWLADHYQATRLRGDGLAALFYVANWRFVAAGRSYAALFSQPSPVAHYWSLGIEEQFYLVFPLLAVGLLAWGRGSRRVLGVGLAVLAVASVVWTAVVYSPGSDPSRVYYGTDTRAAELLVGGLLAVLLAGRLGVLRRPWRIVVATIGTFALGGLVASWTFVHLTDTVLYRGGLLVHAVAAAAVIAAAVQPGPVSSVLGVAPLRLLGRISYGVYVLHWPIFLTLDEERTGRHGVSLFALRFAVTVVVAAASFVVLERPVTAGRRPRVRVRLITAGAAFGVATVLVLSTAWPPPARVVFAPLRSSPSVPPRVRPPSPETVGRWDPGSPEARAAAVHPPLRILVIGDSVALTLGRGLERWGAEHRVAVWNRATFWCGLAYGGRVAMMGSKPSCDNRRQVSTSVRAFDPDAVVVLSTIWDVAGRRLPGWNAFLRPGDPTFDAWLAEAERNMVRLMVAKGAHVVRLALSCVRDQTLQAQIALENRAVGPMLRERFPGRYTEFDLESLVCPDRRFDNRVGPVTGARPDGMHFSDRAADWLAPRVMVAVVDAGLRRREDDGSDPSQERR